MSGMRLLCLFEDRPAHLATPRVCQSPKHILPSAHWPVFGTAAVDLHDGSVMKSGRFSCRGGKKGVRLGRSATTEISLFP